MCSRRSPVQPLLVTKYGFRIRTRHGGVVDNLLIYGRDEHEAVTKLRQIYHDCEVLETRRQVGGGRHVAASFDALPVEGRVGIVPAPV